MDRTERVGRRLRLRDLQLLDAVVRWGSIARAAKQLNLTQSAASKAISQLEHAIGARLLDRNARSVEPTLYGRPSSDKVPQSSTNCDRALRKSSFWPTRRLVR